MIQFWTAKVTSLPAIADACSFKAYRVAQKSKLLYCVNSLLFLSHPVYYNRFVHSRPRPSSKSPTEGSHGGEMAAYGSERE